MRNNGKLVFKKAKMHKFKTSKMIFKIFLFSISLLISFFGKSQNWSWATEISSGGILTSFSIINSDVSYVAGHFNGIQLFGSTVLDGSDGQVYYCKISNDNGEILSVGQLPYYTGGDFSFMADNQQNLIFGFETVGQSIGELLKLDVSGNIAWQFEFTSPSNESYIRPQALITDNVGNIYISGLYNNEIFYNNTSIMDGSDGFFILKLNSFGIIQWVTSSTTGSFYAVHDIAVDNQSNVIVIGDFLNSATIGNSQLSSNGGFDIFITMLESNGNVLWATNAGGTAPMSNIYDQGFGVAVDNSEGIYATGTFAGLAEFSPTVGIVGMGSNQDIFVAKYDYSGNAIWATSAGGLGVDWSRDVSVNQDGESFITGFYQGTALFGNTSLETSIPNVNSNIFIAKCSANGDFMFADRAISHASSSSDPQNDNIGKSIHLDNEGNCYVGGNYNSTIDFGNISIGIQASGIHPFISKYDHLATSTIETSAFKNILVFPNPSSGNFKIQGNKLTKKLKVTIFDLKGKEIYHEYLVNQEIRIDGLAKGIYYLKISNEESFITKKLIVH